MAACTLLDGKLHPSKRKDNLLLQLAVGLPWSIAVSAVCGLGAYTLFALIMGGLNASCFNCAVNIVAGPHVFVLFNALMIGFTSVFMYQKLVWNGGRVWSVVYYGLVALMTLAIGAMHLSYGSLDPRLLSCLCAITFVGLTVLMARLCKQSIARLESTGGAKRVMPHTRAMLVISGSLLLPFLLRPGLHAEATAIGLITFVWISLLATCSGSYVARMNDAHCTETAATLALATWNPIILTLLLQFPVLMVGSLLSAFSLIPQITYVSYLLSAGAIASILSFPVLSAAFGAWGLRRSSQRRLRHLPPELSLERPAIGACHSELDLASS